MDPLPAGLPDWLADHVRLAETLRDIQDGIADIRATAYSPDGLIAATVGGRGEVVELELDPRIYRDQDSTALASTITDTIRKATKDATHEAAVLAARAVPGAEPDDVDPQLDPVLAVLDPAPKRRDAAWRT